MKMRNDKDEVKVIITGFQTQSEPTDPSYSIPMTFSQKSRYARRVRQRYSQELDFLPPGVPQEAHLRRALQLLEERYSLDSALRILRQLVMERLLTLDCDLGLALKEVMLCICTLAQFALSHAAAYAKLTLAAQWGLPLNAAGEEAHIWVVAMGKLGAKELNVSSDIDVVYVYDEDGYTSGAQYQAGAQSISNQEYFLKWVHLISKLIAQVSEHGFVFRIDLGLRPYGSASVSALPLAALAVYFKQDARPWERFAWLKARVLPLQDGAHLQASKRLSALILPFVFRPYLDYSLVQAMRSIHQLIQDQAQKETLKHPGLLDIKLGRGGIREIEFGVQLLQLARVGTHPELRTRSTLKAIEFLRVAKLLEDSEALQLHQAYVFLRRLEHRIQYLDDQQTHRLPTDLEDLEWLGASMGYPDWATLKGELSRHQLWVQGYFDRLLAHPVVQESTRLGPESAEGSPRAVSSSGIAPPANTSAVNVPKDLGPIDHTAQSVLQALIEAIQIAPSTESAPHRESTRPSSQAGLTLMTPAWSKWLESLKLAKPTVLNTERQERVLEVLSRALLWLREGSVSDLQVQAWLDWMEPLLKRDNYWVLLYENPNAHRQLLLVMGASTWSQSYLKAHPSVIDHWLQPNGVEKRIDTVALIKTFQSRKAALARIEQDDEEQLLAVIRREHQAQMFSTLTQDLMGYLTVQEVGDELSALADTVLCICAQWVWRRLNPTWVGEVPLAIIGYGKLGSKELGYGSDLDLVLLYDDLSPITQEQVTKMARQMIQWITLKTAQGRLYEIDSALRPNGNSGLLVSSFSAFEAYQRQLGANSAWTWEHQALTRARFCVGPQVLAQRFDVLRQEVLCAQREPALLAREVVEMRQKMWASLSIPKNLFDPKSSPGGMIDVEFVVQYLVLAHAHRYPELTQNIGNMALLLLAQELGLIPAPLGQQALEAYREFRRLQHQSSLHETALRCDPNDCQKSISAVKALWASQFGS